MTAKKEPIGIVYNEPPLEGSLFLEASLDILTQVGAVEDALADLGLPSIRLPFSRDLGRFLEGFQAQRVRAVFNLCEAVEEDPLLGGHPAAILELLGVPYSGSPPIALMVTTDKLLTKRILQAEGIMTPRYQFYDSEAPLPPRRLDYPVIVKPRFEDASIGIDQESIFSDEISLRKGLPEFRERFGPVLVEEFIEGREFNLSLFGYPQPRVLPIAEIDFSAFPEGLYPIVGYRAKWDRGSFEYHHTPRRFSQGLPAALQNDLETTAIRCFQLFMLRDYGRVDMRIDRDGRIYVLEINANPCISPDAGFVTAAREAGMSYSDMVARLLEFMEHRVEKDGDPACHGSGQGGPLPASSREGDL